jgi:hypothetical protein
MFRLVTHAVFPSQSTQRFVTLRTVASRRSQKTGLMPASGEAPTGCFKSTKHRTNGREFSHLVNWLAYANDTAASALETAVLIDARYWQTWRSSAL